MIMVNLEVSEVRLVFALAVLAAIVLTIFVSVILLRVFTLLLWGYIPRRSQLSSKTLALQRRFTLVVLLQVVSFLFQTIQGTSALVFLFSPILMGTTLYIFGVLHCMAYNACMGFMAGHSYANALVVLVVVPIYRRRALDHLRRAGAKLSPVFPRNPLSLICMSCGV